MSQYFHFTLGPVQSFVAQARRTRDFWAGSFILSLLAAVAMKAVQRQGGKILFPEADEAYLSWLDREPGANGIGPPPRQGCIPNRFKAEVRDNFEPERIAEAVREAWKGLAELVWREDLAGFVEADSETRRIWERQIGAFWEIAWAVTEDEQASDVLDRRKNLRTHPLPDESGPKCMMMDGWQELSGAVRPDSDEQKAFWNRLRQDLTNKLDLRQDEYLCAIAFVKRRFARHFEMLEATLHDGWTLRGWTLPTSVPSVAYLAAAPWLAQVIRQAPEDRLWHFHDEAMRLGERGEWHTDLRCIREAVEATGKRARRFRALDGNLFFESALDNPNLYREREQAEAVKRALAELRRAARLGPPSPYYAVLMMDGDSLGAQMNDVNKQEGISKALAAFTDKVPDIVDEHSGFLVYAGGDDVLAVLPLGEALPCAAKLRRHYLTRFEQQDLCSTLSGAVLYAHIRVPLTRVLRDAHDLLDDIAKDQRGRDAIAARVRNPGGDILTWAMPWKYALDDGNSVIVQELAHEVHAGGSDGPYAGGFFYCIRERLELLNPPDDADKAVLKGDEAVDLMTAEYLQSGIHEGRRLSWEQARATVRRLLVQCRPVVRKMQESVEGPPTISYESKDRYEADGALLVRFLAREAVSTVEKSP